ncbi:NET1-associated nuclear protein 1 [Tilletia horrida]|uniref:NET1-associated nuclear protein 1 n=1 Tax=Tilletia horrida TaxID=155126 RepID=A0AAN6JT69_9BASI|nr:NET1-associated nuclear protein 1 [Tilletia horrida]KAK0555151.1 NET1-associated nuclear protein 1 [Tilletia horrida]KAK0568421.1 NET1-associated nuclear protein 1 [Tilletia horrida]
MPDATGKKTRAANTTATPTKSPSSKARTPASPAAKAKSDSTTTAIKKKSSSASVTIEQDNINSKSKSKSKKKDSAAAPTITAPALSGQPSTSKSTRSAIQWQSLADPTILSTEPPLFTPDGGYYFLPTASTIRIISRSTGTTVSTLSPPDLPFGSVASSKSGLSHRITALALYPSNPLQLLCARTDGTISVWDYLDARLLRIIYLPYSASSSSSQEELETGLAITHLVASEQCPDWAFVSVRRAKSLQGKGNTSFSTLLLAIQLSASVGTDGTATEPLAHVAHSTPAGTQSIPIHIPRAQSRLGKIKLVPAALRLSPRAEHLVVISGHKIHVASLRKRTLDEDENQEQNIITSIGGLAKFTTSDDLTALAIHPSEASIATGDVTGKIRIFHGFLEESFLARRRSEADDEDVEMNIRQQSIDSSSKKGKGKGKSESGAKSNKHSFFGAPSTVLHWHAHAVSTLAYVPLAASGARLLSGGEEATLVLWHMSAGGGAGGSSTRAQKEFVPRLGAGIASVTVAGAADSPSSSSSSNGSSHEEEIVVALRDGSLVFLSPATLAVLRTFARLKMDAGRNMFPVWRQRSMPSPLALQPVRPHQRGEDAYNLVLTSGHPSTIQFYDPVADAMVSELEVVSSNRVSRPDEAPIEPARVELVAFSPLSPSAKVAEWMVTLDARRPSAASQVVRFASEVSLKFWGWDVEEERYVLCTSIERPHGDEGTLSDLSFGWLAASSDGETSDKASNFERLVCVSTGSDGKIKTWKPVPLTRAESLSAATTGEGQGKKKKKGGKAAGTESDRRSAPALASRFHWIARSIFSFRSTSPKSVAWAPTPSSSSHTVGASATSGLVAVAQGAFVTVWELGVSSNSLCVALCAPQLVSVSDAQAIVGKAGAAADLIQGARTCAFVGRAGRFVVGASRTVAVCWDLLTGAIVWTKAYSSGKSAATHQGKDDKIAGQQDASSSSKSSKHITRIIPIPSGSPSNAEEVFGVLVTDSTTRTSTVELFDIASLLRQPERNKPDAVLEIPFSVRSLALVPSATAPAAAASSSQGSGKIKAAIGAIAGYVITSSFEPVQLGRPAALSYGSSSDADDEQQEAFAIIPRDAAEHSVRSRRVRTILDDLLGGGQEFLPDNVVDSVAMSKRKSVAASALLAPPGQDRKKTAGEEVFALFDEPAHLLPPMTALFDAFSLAILPRRAGVGQNHGGDDAGVEFENEADDDDEE